MKSAPLHWKSVTYKPASIIGQLKCGPLRPKRAAVGGGKGRPKPNGSALSLRHSRKARAAEVQATPAVGQKCMIGGAGAIMPPI